MWGLIWANLTRHRTRTTLTWLALVVAFFLFMLLRAIGAAFAGGESIASADRLIVDARYSMTDNLPLAALAQIRSLDGVTDVAQINWFGGFYQDPKNAFATYVVDPAHYFNVYRELKVAPAALERFQTTRIGALASESLVRRFGWSVGDAIPLTADIWPQQNGSWSWRFELVGTFAYPPDAADVPLLLINFDYFNEAVAEWAKNQVGWLAVRVGDPARADEVAHTIDRTFENSADPTVTVTEDEYRRAYAAQLGDIGFVTTMILLAVFFTIVLLTGNTAAQAFRERLPEMAVLKTLGFSDGRVAALLLGEALLLCSAGGAAGMAAAVAIEPLLNAGLDGVVGHFHMTGQSALAGTGLALALGVAIGIGPAWSARRLSIVDGLKRH